MKTNTETSKSNAYCPVNSHNEWDLPEKVIVGVVDGATFPSYLGE
jgi:hypothetical protein